MRILVADDHAALRKGLIQILGDEFPDAEFGEAASTPEALSSVARSRWDVLVLDVFMPGRSGLDVLHEVQREHPALPVLVLSSAPEEQMAVRVLRAGGRGYLNKQAAPEELVLAVRRLVAGGRYISAAVAERLAADIHRTDRAPEDRISDREYDVLIGLMAGKAVKEIAGELNLSPKTVSTYHTRIWEKLGVDNDADLIRYALGHGLVEGGRRTGQP